MQTFDTLFTTCPIKTYRKGTMLIQPGEVRSSVFWIKKGFVQKCFSTPNGEILYVSLFDPSSFLPLSVSINNIPTQYIYEALTDIEVMIIPQQTFVQTINTNSLFMQATLSYVLQETTILKEKLIYFMLENALARVTFGLCFFAAYFGEKTEQGVSISVPLSQKAMSMWLGLTRESVNVQLTQLYKEKRIQYLGKHILIPNIDRLKMDILHEISLIRRKKLRDIYEEALKRQ